MSGHEDEAAPGYTVSSFSSGGSCVEVGRLAGDRFSVRDTKDPHRRVSLEFDHDEWLAFVRGVKAGEFDV